MSPVKDVALRPTEEIDLSASASAVSIFERLARDPSIDVSKLERLMSLYEHGRARLAEEQFNAAMSQAQQAMRPIAADAENPQTRSKYASYAALDRALRPLYTAQGFGLSFDTGDGAPADWVRVLCYVTHTGGHARTYHIDVPADGKGAKGGDVMTKTHAVGSANSYGMRYLLRMIFNVSVGDEDDDGNAAGQKNRPEPPPGFAAWLHDIRATADTGTPALRDAYRKSKQEYRLYLETHVKGATEELKARAQQADRKAKASA